MVEINPVVHGQMMAIPLTLASVMRHAERVCPDSRIVSITADNSRHRYTLREAFQRVRRLANVLHNLGLPSGTRVGTLAWNDHRHLEAYYAISCSGYVCHTINPRLFPAQIEYIANHARDRVLLVDPAFVPLVEKLAPELRTVDHFIALTGDRSVLDGTTLRWLCYEDLLAAASPEFSFPDLDEDAACALAYTSGTTGAPKGVLYSHRSTVLHTYAVTMPTAFALSPRDVVLAVVPMFHVNAWSLPYAVPASGATLVLPGSKMGDAAILATLINEERVTCAAGVPTVWINLLAYLRTKRLGVPSLERVIVGGSACSRALLEAFENEHDVDVLHAWGMTEMSPLGTVNTAPRSADIETRLKQGKPIFGIELKIIDAHGHELPWDGVTSGYLKVRGPWVCRGYFQHTDSPAHYEHGWFDTGDVATIDRDGYLQITDRAKDIIKSGGEWISSIDLENAALMHPLVQESAVIGVPHPKWDERPVLYVVSKDGTRVDEGSLRHCLARHIADWWLPETIVQVDTLPHTATGKLDKRALREQHAAVMK
ncbi:long-chain fatty acid--CoA ligase [Povalibacter sp.]|uniref:long-chain fatty acid--CoA ligase n=1 Tax=Povalibacter sp. TaxID=1962978 RepID=UPI002F3EFBEB